MNIFRAYNRVMIKHPIKTQCITNACLVATGDIIAQKLIEKQPELIVKRTAKFALFGLVYIVCTSFRKVMNVYLFFHFLKKIHRDHAYHCGIGFWIEVLAVRNKSF